MSLPAQFIEFGEWLPDQPPGGNNGVIDAVNVVPLAVGYGPLYSLNSFTNSLNAQAISVFWVNDSTGQIHNFAASTTRLFKLGGTDNNTWADVSKDGANYTLSSSWEFIKFGDRVIATNGEDVPQFYDLINGSAFEDLPNAPIARHIAVVRDFIVLGDLDGAPSDIRWSAFNDSESWAPSRSTQADIQRLFGRGGSVQRIIPGEYGVVFQEHSIYRMDYASAGITFRIDEKERGRGTPASGSVCWRGNAAYYYGYDDFYVFNGEVSEPLGVNRVSRWIEDHIDPAGLTSMRAVVNRQAQYILWAFKTDASQAYNNKLMLYNWGADKWSHANVDTSILGEMVRPASSVDSTAFNTLYRDNIDGANQRSFDDPVYQGNRLNIVAFTTNNQAATFTGTIMPATLESKEISGTHGRHILINSIRPEIDGTDVAARSSIGYRNSPLEAPVFTASSTVNTLGEVNIRRRARYQRVRLNIDSDFNFASGISLESREGGKK